MIESLIVPEIKIKKLLADIEIGTHFHYDYDQGYYDGYKKALIDVMDRLGIPHEEIKEEH